MQRFNSERDGDVGAVASGGEQWRKRERGREGESDGRRREREREKERERVREREDGSVCCVRIAISSESEGAVVIRSLFLPPFFPRVACFCF